VVCSAPSGSEQLLSNHVRSIRETRRWGLRRELSGNTIKGRCLPRRACASFQEGGADDVHHLSHATCNMPHPKCNICSVHHTSVQHATYKHCVRRLTDVDTRSCLPELPRSPRSLPSTRNDCVGTSYRCATFRPRSCPKGRTLFGSRRPRTSLRFALTSPARDCPFLCAPRHRTTTGPPRSSVCCICVRFRALVFGALRRACQ
jgi:hypothetical protein